MSKKLLNTNTNKKITPAITIRSKVLKTAQGAKLIPKVKIEKSKVAIKIKPLTNNKVKVKETLLKKDKVKPSNVKIPITKKGVKLPIVTKVIKPIRGKQLKEVPAEKAKPIKISKIIPTKVTKIPKVVVLIIKMF